MSNTQGYLAIGCEKFYIREGLVYKSKRAPKYAFDISNYIQWNLSQWNIPFYDPCTSVGATDFPVRFDTTAGLQRFNGTDWIAVVEPSPVFSSEISITNGTGNVANILATSISGTKNLTLPNATGTLVVSVNGIAPTVAGNVVLTGKPMTKFTPVTTGTITLIDNGYNVVNPAGTIAALTVTMPASPADRDVVEIKYTQAVTTITYAGGTVVTGETGATVGQYTRFQYDLATTTWY